MHSVVTGMFQQRSSRESGAELRIFGSHLTLCSTELNAREFAPLFGKFSNVSNMLRLGGGAGGIRTLDTLLTYTHFPGERLRPLGHRSACTGRRLPIVRRGGWQGDAATFLLQFRGGTSPAVALRRP
jgi:hypothetical protein